MTELDECGCLTGGYLFVLGVGLVFRLYACAYNRALGSFRLWQHNGNKNSVVVMTTTTEYLLFLPQKMRKIYNLLTFNPVYFIMASLSLPLSLSLLSISVSCTCKYMRTTNFSCISTQRSWVKVMFLHVSVILFTGVVSQYALQVVSQHALQQVSGVVSQHALQVVSQHALQVSRGEVSRPTPRGEVEGSGKGGLQAHTQGGLQAHTQGVCIPACTEADPPPMDGYCHGW